MWSATSQRVSVDTESVPDLCMCASAQPTLTVGASTAPRRSATAPPDDVSEQRIASQWQMASMTFDGTEWNDRRCDTALDDAAQLRTREFLQLHHADTLVPRSPGRTVRFRNGANTSSQRRRGSGLLQPLAVRAPWSPVAALSQGTRLDTAALRSRRFCRRLAEQEDDRATLARRRTRLVAPVEGGVPRPGRATFSRLVPCERRVAILAVRSVRAAAAWNACQSRCF